MTSTDPATRAVTLRRAHAVLLVTAALAATGCQAPAPTVTGTTTLRPAATSSASPTPTTVDPVADSGPTPIPTAALSVPVASQPVAAVPAPPQFQVSVAELDQQRQAEMDGVTWRPGCPVPLLDLRRVSLSHWDFDGQPVTGELVVHVDAVPVVTEAFRQMFEDRFPIRRMVPIEAYGGDDFASIEDDNTSAFNCRDATGSPGVWSQHAYGLAIDINPLENPYIFSDGSTSHRASRPFLDRAEVRPGMITDGSVPVDAFESAGWIWGGRWNSPTDLQHFAARR